jgi:single-strand DNA-binding protein
LNKVVLIGRLTKDPELKFTPGAGTAVTTLTLAVDRRIKKEGQPEADFINCVAFGKTAEIMAQYLGKGRLIGVSGWIRTGSYEAKDGTRRYTTDVYIDEFQFLEKGNGAGSTNVRPNTSASNSDFNAPGGFGNNDSFDMDMTPVDDGDIPF